MYRILALTFVSILVSCSSISKEKGSLITRPFSDVDTNREIVVSANRTFEIVLPSNRSTGYTWNLEINHPEVISKISDKYIADKSGRVGVAGETIWTLKSRNNGDANLTFSYQRPLEENAAPTRIEKFYFSVR
ncbi:MAG: protease inhibitor I42 family protein [Phycisphaerales bacterium]|jgi:predicted secreted protein|nr:protease inhibitor I42 family protein [Phycisphaerales bacterium]